MYQVGVIFLNPFPKAKIKHARFYYALFVFNNLLMDKQDLVHVYSIFNRSDTQGSFVERSL